MDNTDTERADAGAVQVSSGRTLLMIGGVLVVLMLVGGYFLFVAPKQQKSLMIAESREQAELPTLGSVPVGPELIERSGEAMRLGDLRGKVWIASFIFTRCRGTCPMMSSALSTIQKSIEGMDRVRLVSFTVDPEYDTPEKLREYATELDASPSQWLFLTGQEDSLQALARDVFHLGVEEGGSVEEPIIHSTRFVLVDAVGEIRGYYEGLDSTERSTMMNDVKRLTTSERGSDGA